MTTPMPDTITPPLSAKDEFRRGWGIIAASVLGIGLGQAAMPTYSMGLFAPHLASQFGWGVGQIMTCMTIIMLVTLVAGPMSGALAERIGARRVVLWAIPLWGAGFCTLALSDGSLTRYYVTWALIALVGSATLPITFTRGVNRAFDKAKGLALGLSMTGTGLFGIFGKPFVAVMIAKYGWQTSFVALGLLPIALAWPAAWFLYREDDTGSHGAEHAPAERPGLTLAEALRDYRFWLMALALVPVSFALGGPVPNMELILKDGGLTPVQVMAIAPLMGLASMTGRLVGGFLLDRIWAPAVAFVVLSLPAISFLYFASGALSPGMAAAAVFTLSFALGIEYDAVAFFVARYFGLRRYGGIYGLLYICFALGAGISPMFFGRDHDAFGNFHHILTLSAYILVPSAALFLLLGKYRRFAD
ncbi:MFS transporter [Novosphingobium sp. FSY-8]|uniref:MFS transporter n=1 Tax=Novosphingobium ovatum TaxID=1908523 RepID=A0ABW9X900_9SPHN|nr:MFS transporter [Novosphingobium ovatum]NBC35001.1 MFS transporter [Novosphingobium ovatum]